MVVNGKDGSKIGEGAREVMDCGDGALKRPPPSLVGVVLTVVGVGVVPVDGLFLRCMATISRLSNRANAV